MRKGATIHPEEIESYEYSATLSEDEFKTQFSNQLSQKSRTQPDWWMIRSATTPPSRWRASPGLKPRPIVPGCLLLRAGNIACQLKLSGEAAARGLSAWHYPWGNDWDPMKANGIEGRLLKTSPVGAYAAAGGKGPFRAQRSGRQYPQLDFQFIHALPIFPGEKRTAGGPKVNALSVAARGAVTVSTVAVRPAGCTSPISSTTISIFVSFPWF